MLRALDLFFGLPLARRSRNGGPEHAERILVIELWNIGDIVLAMPFLSQLRKLFPKARVAMLARPYARTVLEGTGLVDDFIDTELGWSEKSVRRNPFAYHWRELARVRRAIKRGKFDIAFSSRMHVREYVLLALSGAKRRVAFALGYGERVLTDAVPVADINRHKVDDWLELLKPFGGAVGEEHPRLKVSEYERHWAMDFLAQHFVSTEDRLVGLHPGASVPAKRWPLERFAEVATTLAQMPDTRVVAFVSPDGYGDELSRVPNVIAARVTLRELMALVERCDVLVCNDSGPMHVAGALGVPTVSVFGSGINRWFSPLGEGHRLLTSTRSGRASLDPAASVAPYDVAGVDTAEVLDALNEVLRPHAANQP